MISIRLGAIDHLLPEGLECSQAGMLGRQPIVELAHELSLHKKAIASASSKPSEPKNDTGL
ncbi:MAG TPA: hypothetical protein VKR55_12035 [Bradyrhizobium sp.]|uniref:hypothetical protein n=1 Tax=Bradyrhizobium sp. TaxID=376 RepID=UPI002C12F6CE|nr:hypothetical protein [Bradyrhizobium sp.]HLZ02868.1 hypothetical protein [Bradyrhizobium sp.]